MDITFIIILIGFIAAVLWALKAGTAAALFRQKAESAERSLLSATESADKERMELITLRNENARLTERTRTLTSLLESERAQTSDRFRTLAQEVLKQTSTELKSANETRLTEILSPLEQNIRDFRASLDSSLRAEAEGRASLKAHIETLNALNISIGKEARELSSALRGNSKVQGDWGEMILTTLLAKSGLQEGIHFTVQQTRSEADNSVLRGDEGRHLRPDVVMCYPDGKKVVIDSKVSLSAFTRMVNAESEEERKAELAMHLKSVRKHVDELASKDYPKALGSDVSMDFSLMFIPHEPAYLSAMEADNTLWEYAYNKKVVIVSPTHLLSVLRLLSQVWQQDKINRNTIRIAEESGKMLDMLFSFKEDLDKVESSLNSALDAYASAQRRLFSGNGNVARRAARLIELGAKAKKKLPWESTESNEESD